MRTRIVAVAVVVALSTAGFLAGCTPPDTYVALGDSYTSGPGIQPQDPSIPGCLRSQVNYPHLVAPDLGSLVLRDVSCSGAQTEDMTASQDVDPDPDPRPQLDALGRTTKVVTLGIGGNDIGFVDIAETCVQLATQQPLATAPCRDHYTANGVITDRIAALAPRLDSVLTRIARRSPSAKVFVVGYPDILPEDPADYVLCRPVLPVATGDIPFLRDHVEKLLNRTVRDRAIAHGAVYVNTYRPSIGHDACQAPSVRWVEPVAPAADAAPVHPNRLGMEATAAAARATMRAHGVPVG
jgi:GDSL-like Lipase/Acylhydrolase family